MYGRKIPGPANADELPGMPKREVPTIHLSSPLLQLLEGPIFSTRAVILH
jgi:hypothetical protein